MAAQALCTMRLKNLSLVKSRHVLPLPPILEEHSRPVQSLLNFLPDAKLDWWSVTPCP